MGLFRPKLLIDSDELDWQLATFKWLIQEFGPVERYSLILPTAEWFPATRGQGRERDRALFDQVRCAAGMDDWPCDLEPGSRNRRSEAGNALLLQHDGEAPPCGTFRIRAAQGHSRVVITYNPDLADDPPAMIATFAHELGHYLMISRRNDPPGGMALHELHTDLAAVYLGFGIFMANSARTFHQFQSAGEMGWSTRLQGYLSEAALITGTVIFERLRGADPLEAAPYLKSYLRSDLKKTAKALARLHPDLPSAVERMDLSEYEGG